MLLKTMNKHINIKWTQLTYIITISFYIIIRWWLKYGTPSTTRFWVVKHAFYNPIRKLTLHISDGQEIQVFLKNGKSMNGLSCPHNGKWNFFSQRSWVWAKEFAEVFLQNWIFKKFEKRPKLLFYESIPRF